MTRRTRTAVVTALSCLAAGALALLLWLPWNPFEEDAGPLDAWVPADADAVVRFDAGALQRSELVRTLWDGPAGERLRAALALDDVVAAVRDADASLASLAAPGASPPTVAGDLLGREVLVALRGDDALVMARISGRAKALDLLRRAGEERRARWGIRFDAARDAYEADGGDGPRVGFARRRDVLLVSASRGLLDAALSLAGGAGKAITTRDAYVSAHLPGPGGARVAAWCDGKWLAPRLPSLPVVGHLQPGADTTVRAEVRFDDDAVHATFTYGADAPSADAAATAALADAAASYAQASGAFASGAVAVEPRVAFTALFESQPPARRRLLASLLAERHRTVEGLIDGLARHVGSGVGFAVARLPETDELDLDRADSPVVEPIPATFAVLRPAGAPSEFLDAVRENATELFGEDAHLDLAMGPAGEPMLCVRGTRAYGPEWALLRPAFAARDDEVVFCTNEACLRRALAARRPASARGAGELFRLDVSAEGWRARLLDLRWEAADRATWHDWAAERRAFRAQRRVGAAEVSPADARRLEDQEIERRVRVRNEEEFPGAVAEYRRSLEWLRAFEGASVDAARGAAGEVTLRCEIRAAGR